MPFDKTYTDLPLWAARDEGQGYYIFGTEIAGADVQLLALPLGFVDPEIVAAQDAARQQAGAAQGQAAATTPDEPAPGVSTVSTATPPAEPSSQAPATVSPDAADAAAPTPDTANQAPADARPGAADAPTETPADADDTTPPPGA